LINIKCNLCDNDNLLQINCSKDRSFYLCEKCFLISISEANYISPKEEKERYLKHNNGIEFEGYVNFLSRAINPTLNFLNKSMIGLDFGCGYSQTLSKILYNKGYNCEDYDPFFVQNALNKKYDFIFSTEVFEHFFNPKKEITKLINLVKKDGIIIIMTERWNSIDKFENWYYKNDPTHVAFFNKKTFDFIGHKFNLKILYDDGERIIIFRKN